MIRKHENAVSWKAGTLSLLVHIVLLAALLISFNWKAAHTVLNVTEVDLWDKLPAHSLPKPPEVKIEPPPVPVVKEEPKPEPPKPIVEDKPKPEEPKVDIELEKKKEKLLEEKKLEEKRKKDEEKKKLLAALRDEDLQDKKTAKKDDALKKLQQEALNEDKGESEKQASAANASLKNEYIAKIQAKIRGNVNKTLCGEGSPEIRVEISLLPTGDLGGSPKITKSSGNSACDDAVERAVMASQPLPLPTDTSLRSDFRNLNLHFRPNDN